MRKRIIAGLLGVFLAFVTLAGAGLADGTGITWTEEARARLRTGNTTAIRGRFFTTMWGGTTSDLDVQDLLHGYSPVRYDVGTGSFRFDRSVVQDGAAIDDYDGNRTYLLVLYDDLKWSDGTPITAADYVFSILLTMDPVIGETGGQAMDYSWISGAEEYLDRTSPVLSGVRIITDQILKITATAESLPYFYELSRLMIHPYPASVIAPGISVMDDGDGVYLSEPLTAEMIRETVLDEESGYLVHPSVVSGPYTLTSFEWPTAKLAINPYYKGNEDGMVPRIGELEYTLADNRDMMEKLTAGEFGLLNKVTLNDSIVNGLKQQESGDYAYSATAYPRTGLTMVRFSEKSFPMQDPAVRKAIAYCFDRENFIRDYVEPYGLQVDGLYGLGQWVFRLATGQMKAPVNEELPEEESRAAAEAFEGLKLNGLTKYSLDTAEACRLLEKAGWTVNAEGVRSKTIGGETVELRLTMGLPESDEARDGLEMYLVPHLAEAGIAVTLVSLSMLDAEKAYRGESKMPDMLYLGEDYTIAFEAGILAPQEAAEGKPEDSLTAAKAELYGMAREMMRTEPADIAGFMRKWVALQERLSETLPLLPVYSNVYFDFYSRELHDYRITEAVSWGEAIVESYVSDVEMLDQENRNSIKDGLAEAEQLIRQLEK